MGGERGRESSGVLRFQTGQDMREIILLATLSGKPVRVTEIRGDDAEAPGLRPFEINLLQLVEKVSNGSRVSIDPTGTALSYQPGVLTGGSFLEHHCDGAMGIGYYLEALVFLAVFSKEPVEIDLHGITNDNGSQSVDVIRTVTLPLLEKFGVPMDEAELRVVRRGAPPGGGGLIHCRLPVVREKLDSVQLEEVGEVARMRGIAFSARVSPHLGNRVLEAARGMLHTLNRDIFIHADHFKGAEGGLSPGYGLTLVAETSTGMLLSAERFAEPGDTSLVAEDLGLLTATQLLHEILVGGCVDSSSQWLPLLLMALTPRNVSKIVLGRLTPFTMRVMRLIDQFLGVQFKISVQEHPRYLVRLSCVGSGYKNLNRRVT